MRLVVIGANGMIGSRIAAEARLREHEVTAASRTGKDGGRAVDASDVDAVSDLASGHDAAVVAVRLQGKDPIPGHPLAMCRALLDGLRKAKVRRVIVVGGAGSLEASPGVRVMDLPNFPGLNKPEADAQADLLDLLRNEADDLDWTYVSPGGMIAPGERTGVFRVGGDQLLKDSEGKSHISAEDYAIGLVDRLDSGDHVRTRINLGY